MPVKKDRTLWVALLSICVLTIGCSGRLSRENLLGSYSASYPFGREDLTLNNDGTFLQKVMVDGQGPVVARGRWEFDPKHSQVDFHGLMWVADGFGHLRDNWRTISPGLTASLPAEQIWLRITLNSGASYPYLKR